MSDLEGLLISNFMPDIEGSYKDPLRATSPLTARIVPKGVLSLGWVLTGCGRRKPPGRVVGRATRILGSAQRENPLSLEARTAWERKPFLLQCVPYLDCAC